MFTACFLVSKTLSSSFAGSGRENRSDSEYQKGDAHYKPPFRNEPENYRKLRALQENRRRELLSSTKRFQRISERKDRSDWPPGSQRRINAGKHLARYRGFDICKAPEDFVLYHQLFALVKPETIIELGTLSGGMAVWMADTLKLLEISCNIYSMDIDPSSRSEVVERLKPANVTFLQGDSYAIEKTFTKAFLSQLSHPWIFIEDAHANLPGVLRHFHKHCLEGDYMVVEDTCPDTAKEFGSGLLGNPLDFPSTGRKHLDCLRHFLEEYEDYYAIDSFINDLFGYNGCRHWHGFLRKMK